VSVGFSAAPDSFPNAANRLRVVAQGVLDAWAPARQHTLGVRFGRGDDLLSPLIQVSLSSAVRLIDSSLSTSAQALAEAADALEQMGATYQEADLGVKHSVDTLDSAAFG
jgi:hypothetical protein